MSAPRSRRSDWCAPQLAAVAGLRTDSAFHTVVLDDGSEIPCRTVIVVPGARYQRLAVADLERFEAARLLRRNRPRSPHLHRVGGDRDRRRNSAGQAAATCATGQRRFDRDPRERSRQEHVGLSHRADRGRPAHPSADEHRSAHWKVPRTERHRRVHTDGRAPNPSVHRALLLHRRRSSTEWLEGVVALDAGGFVLTDRSLRRRARHDVRHAIRCPSRRRYLGVFAGRRCAMPRSGRAAAVGEGSSAGPIGARSPRHDLARATDACWAPTSNAMPNNTARTDDGPHRLVRHERAVQRSDAPEDPHDPDDDQERSDDEPCHMRLTVTRRPSSVCGGSRVKPLSGCGRGSMRRGGAPRDGAAPRARHGTPSARTSVAATSSAERSSSARGSAVC